MLDVDSENENVDDDIGMKAGGISLKNYKSRFNKIK